MIDVLSLPMQEISKNDIIGDKSISWTIKYDLIYADKVYIVTIGDNDLLNYRSDLVQSLRKYNKTHENKRFIFSTKQHFIYYIVQKYNIDADTYKQQLIEQDLEYAYGKRQA